MKKLSKAVFWLGVGFGIGVIVKRLFLQDVKLFHFVSPPLFGWMDRGKSDQELIEELDASGLRIRQQLMETHPSERNYKVLNHIIGIEKWGQRRLKVSMGEPFIMDEYNGYRPPMGLSWNELQDEFAQTRQETIALARTIKEQQVGDKLVLHNMYGPLTPAMWMTYLRIHAEGELWKFN